VAVEMRRRRVELLAVCGGDGSFFRTLSALAEVYGRAPLPMFLPLRGGSMNTIARGLGCRRATPEAALEAVLRACAEGEKLDVIERALIRVNGRYVGFMSGAGTVVGFLQAYYDGPRKGPLGAARLMGRLAWAAAFRTALIPRVFRWVRARARCDGGEVPFAEFSFFYASNVAEIGIGFRPTYRAGERTDSFHFLAGPLTARDFLRSLGRIYRGLPTGLPNMYDALARRVEIEFEEPQPFMVDGDILDPERRLALEAGPVLRIVRGWQ
jgi:diacylglycerol kinase family enzyme